MSEDRDPYTSATNVLTQRIEEYAAGLRPMDINEVIRLKAALAADRPVADHILTTVFNEFSFLHREFKLGSDEEFSIIMNFLEAFLLYTQQELLHKDGTHKDGLAMQKAQGTPGQENL